MIDCTERAYDDDAVYVCCTVCCAIALDNDEDVGQLDMNALLRPVSGGGAEGAQPKTVRKARKKKKSDPQNDNDNDHKEDDDESEQNDKVSRSIDRSAVVVSCC